MVCVCNGGGEGSAFVFSRSEGNDDAVGKVIWVIGGKDRILGASCVLKS